MERNNHIRKAIGKVYRPTIEVIKNLLSKPNKEACLILGFPKSGTTAIAALLAERSDRSVTMDTKYLWEPYLSKLRNEEISLKRHIYTKCYPFSKDIIKEPSLSYFIDELPGIFTMDKYILVIRNPFDAIRSVLNRLNLSGDAQNIELELVPYSWRSMFRNDKSSNYISAIATRWISIYRKLQVFEKENCIIVRYEDFLKDKEGYICDLATKLGFVGKNEISHLVNHQFQSKGDRDVNLLEFYGQENFKLIEEICGELMNSYDYHSPSLSN